MDGEGVLVQAVRKGRWAVLHCPPCGQFLQGGHTIWISLLVLGCSLFLLGVAVGGCRACRGGTALSIPELPTFITGPWNVISALRTLTGNPVSCYVVSVVTGVDVGECARSAMFSLLGMAGKASHCEIKLERRHCESLETMPLQICTVRNS